MMECKKALVETDGDLEKAVDLLRSNSALKAEKKASRVAADGMLVIHQDQGSVSAVEINTETDFAAKDENFSDFAGFVLDTVFSKKEDDIDALLAAGLEQTRQELVQKIGENITVRRAVVCEEEGGTVGAYVHSNNKIAVLVTLRGGDEDLAKDIAMHVAAVNPMVVKAEDVPAEVLNKESEIYSAQAAESGKPADIIEKMVSGRLRKYVEEVSLTEQAFVKDPDVKVGKLAKDAGAEILSFVRFEVGEGIEKKAEDFAAEVAAQLKGE